MKLYGYVCQTYENGRWNSIYVYGKFLLDLETAVAWLAREHSPARFHRAELWWKDEPEQTNGIEPEGETDD